VRSAALPNPDIPSVFSRLDQLAAKALKEVEEVQIVEDQIELRPVDF
jgi:hypothetical protein